MSKEKWRSCRRDRKADREADRNEFTSERVDCFARGYKTMRSQSEECLSVGRNSPRRQDTLILQPEDIGQKFNILFLMN